MKSIWRMKIPLVALLCSAAFCSNLVNAQSSFQPYNTQGANLIHVETADFTGSGSSVRDFVVGMTVDGEVIGFKQPAEIRDPAANNRLWSYQLDGFAVMIGAGDIEDAKDQPSTDEILIPCTDGNLVILDHSGAERIVIPVTTAALYTADVGHRSDGSTRIVTGGVDGKIRLYDSAGKLTDTLALPPDAEGQPQVGIIRRVLIGNFDGKGGDEAIAFYDTTDFRGGNYYHIFDLDTLAAPAYWVMKDGSKPLASLNASDISTLGWTDKQLPHAYDMDGDGDDEVVGHWGVWHPELGGAHDQTLSKLVTPGELLHRKIYQAAGETRTGKYLLQQGVPGNFSLGEVYPGAEMFTIYGDDLYLVNYDLKADARNRFRIGENDYGYAHTLYHFSDVARLESGKPGVADKVVLAGPINGDDHFYVVDLNGTRWKEDAKTIDGQGVLGAVRDTLDTLAADLDNFAGTAAVAGEPIWFVNFFNSKLGWKMTDANIERRVVGIQEAMQAWSDELFGDGYQPQRIHWTASLSTRSNGGVQSESITKDGMVRFFRALAKAGIHSCLSVGHNDEIDVSAEDLADYFEASVVDGKSYLMPRTKELKEPAFMDLFKPHLEALRARANKLGVAPPKFMYCGKGPIFSAMTQADGKSYFPEYKDMIILGVENSNVTAVDWSFSERAGLWLNGDVLGWACNSIGDNLTANRIVEWGGMRNGHVVLRHLLSQYALGANVYRITSISHERNPLYAFGDTTDSSLKWSNPYRQGIGNFLKMVEKGVYPNSPEPGRIKGISPVAVGLNNPNAERLQTLCINHDYNWYDRYTHVPGAYVINNLACWDGYTEVPDTDATAILFNSKLRWAELLPTSASGFVPMVPYASARELEAQPWCRIAYETDGDTWKEFTSLTEARDQISAELIAQRVNQLFYVENECFWQVTEDKGNPNRLFAVLMDSNVLTPAERQVNLRRGAAAGTWAVFDQLGSQTVPLGKLARSEDFVSLTIPAGSVRCLRLERIGD